MKRILISVFISLLCYPNIWAEKTPVSITGYKKILSTNPTTVRRVPAKLPIQVTYDDCTRIIEVVGYESLSGEVFLIDEFNQTLEYSPNLNCTFRVPDSIDNLLVELN